MIINQFAAFILSHGRPNNVITYSTLKKQGYTGPIHIIVDNEDSKAQEYIENYGTDNVHIFNKKQMADEVDEGNNFDERRTITHARNACFEIAKKIGVKYFIQLDDDYTVFTYTCTPTGQYTRSNVYIKNMDKIFEKYLKLYSSINAKTIAFAQGGDFIAGENSTVWKKPISRKAMNSFFCSVDRPFKFVGAMNEDVNTYTTLGSRGNLFITIPLVRLEQKPTQSQAGGITDMYLKFGTMAKAFTTVMMMPSCVKINMMGVEHKRIHHKIFWKNCVPEIIQAIHKKN